MLKGLKRAQTSDYYDYVPPPRHDDAADGDRGRSIVIDDVDVAPSHGSHRSSRSQPGKVRASSQRAAGLTESNLRAWSATSRTSAAGSRAGVPYRSPYVETLPRDTTLSRPTLGPPLDALSSPRFVPTTATRAKRDAADSTPRHSLLVHRPRSDPALRDARDADIDLNLAYGPMPPDLAARTDLARATVEEEAEATALLDRVHGLLEAAECAHAGAAAAMARLERDPEAAAAVALTLAELSALLAQLSPALLAAYKAGFPVVFALLASPQFLIGTGIAVGVTVIVFGGLKILKRIREVQAGGQTKAGPLDGEKEVGGGRLSEIPQQQQQQEEGEGEERGPAQGPGSVDEALLVDEVMSQISSIETWRRGIAPFSGDATVDVELISPVAMRARRRRDQHWPPPSLRAAESRAATARPSRRDGGGGGGSSRQSMRSGRSREEVVVEGTDLADEEADADEAVGGGRRRGGGGGVLSGLGDTDTIDPRDSISHSGRSERSRRSSHSRRSQKSSGHRSHRSRREGDGAGVGVNVPVRGSSRREGGDGEGGSRATARSKVKMIEDGTLAPDTMLESVLGKKKPESLLKKMFRGRDKEKRDRTVVSALV